VLEELMDGDIVVFQKELNGDEDYRWDYQFWILLSYPQWLLSVHWLQLVLLT
jgi:hypothetical protein